MFKWPSIVILINFLTVMAMATQDNAGFGFQGSWFDPNTNGQGFDIQYIQRDDDKNELIVYWYTYDKQATKQVWLLAQGRIKDSLAENIPLYSVTGGMAQNPKPVIVEQVGTMTLRLNSCNQILMSWQLNKYFEGIDFQKDNLVLQRLSPVPRVNRKDLCSTPHRQFEVAGVNRDEGSACFYEHKNYQGQSFCLKIGEAMLSLANKEHLTGIDWYRSISSIKINGAAEVVVSELFVIRQSVPDLSQVVFRGMRNEHYDDKISAVRVMTPQAICLYDLPNYQGNEHCLPTGKQLHLLIVDLDQKVASIKFPEKAEQLGINLQVGQYNSLYYNAGVACFSRRTDTITESIPDLRYYKNGIWNNNINCVYQNRN